MSNSDKIKLCILAIEIKCAELSKLTDPNKPIEREYSLLCQRLLKSFESLHEKQEKYEEKEQKIKEKKQREEDRIVKRQNKLHQKHSKK